MLLDAEYYNEKCKNAWCDNDYTKALEYNAKSIELNPKCERYYYNRGSLLRESKRFEEALDAFKKGVEVNPVRADGYRLLGEAYDALKNNDEAMQAYKKGLMLRPDDGMILYDIGLIYKNCEEYNKAVEYFSKSIDAGYRDYYPYLFRALIYNNHLEEFKKALEDVNIALQLEPGNVHIRALQIAVYNNLGDTQGFSNSSDSLMDFLDGKGKDVN